MKKMLTLALLTIMTATMVGCGGKTTQSEPRTPSTEKLSIPKAQAAEPTSKSLIVYFSNSGNTRALAEQIRERTGSDIVELKTVTPYTTVYNDLTKQARHELDSGYKPKLQPLNINISEYHTIFIGSPIWWSNIATPVISFLSQTDLSNKTIIPFVTHGGSGIGRSLNHIKELAPQANVYEPLAVRGRNVANAQSDIEQWLNRLGVK